jgi:amino acid transporter
MFGYCAGAAIVAPRYLYAMARDRYVPALLVATGRRGTPEIAILAAGAVSLVFVWKYDFLSLLDASVLFSLVQHAITVGAAWRLRRVIPTAGRFVAPGGPITPLLALVAIVVLCVLAFRPSPGSGAAVDLGHFISLAIVLALGAVLGVLSRRFSTS